jgi:ParB-like chromosome segregation protein Spo0J
MANKSREKRNREYETEFVNLDEVDVPQRTIDRIMRKDHGQIEELRADFENGRDIVRVVLRRRCGGGYNVEDGRHRVIAAKFAGVSFIEAIIVGN